MLRPSSLGAAEPPMRSLRESSRAESAPSCEPRRTPTHFPGWRAAVALRATVPVCAARAHSAAKGRTGVRARAGPALFASCLPHLRDGTVDRVTELQRPGMAPVGWVHLTYLCGARCTHPHAPLRESSRKAATRRNRAQTATKDPQRPGRRPLLAPFPAERARGDAPS